MNTQLLVVSIGHIVSIVILLGLATFVLWSGGRKTVHITFFLLNLAVVSFNLVFLLGTTATDQEFAHLVWLFNASDILIAAFFANWIFALIDETRQYKKLIAWFYAAGGALLAAIFFFPQYFVPSVSPKLYLNFYADAGVLYQLMLVYFFAVVLTALFFLLRKHNSTNDEVERNRLRYVIIGSVFGYGTGSTAFLLVLDLPVDPIFSMLLGLYNLIFWYAISKHNLMDIRTVIRQAAIYAVLIGMISLLMLTTGTLNNFIIKNIPGFKPWIIPLAAGIIAVIIGHFSWRKLRETEDLKQEFITVAAHNLRTPLTRIKFLALAILNRATGAQKAGKQYIFADADRQDIGEIMNENARLIELIGILLEITKAETLKLQNTGGPVEANELLRSMLPAYEQRAKQKNIQFEKNIPEEKFFINVNPERFSVVLRVVLDNALIYTPSVGTVEISLYREKNSCIVSVRDSGIGIAQKDLPNIFSKFYRTEQALRTDTEGVGLGLFMARNIVQKYGGTIAVASPGEGRGSTFYIKLPLARLD